MKFKEELLQFIWQYKLFANKNLISTRGEPLEIIETGKLNVNAGADFIHAKVKIGSTTLVGNIEIHIRERDWIAHQHDKDKAYRNIILHVVYIADSTVNRNFETLELQPLVNQSLLHKYQMLYDNRVKIPCFYIFKKPVDVEFSLWMHKLLVERLEQKIYALNEVFLQNSSDWNRTTVSLIAAYLGGNLNKEPLMQLMMSFDFNILAKYCKNVFKIEALLFGQAGMLEGEPLDEYHQKLLDEYNYIKLLFKLEPINVTSWKFSRLRPSAFPTIRIAQLAKMLFVHRHLFDDLIKHFDMQRCIEFLNMETSEYWKSHYHFGHKKERVVKKSIGKSAIEVIVINAIIPLLFYYGKETDNQDYCDQAIQLLENMKPETNNITILWESLGIKAKTAFESQALIQLKNNYCNQFRCLKCSVGLHLLKDN